MIRIAQYDSSGIYALLERNMYDEVVECATETVERFLPFRGKPPTVTDSLLIHLARTLLAKSIAQVRLKQYNESRFTARRASQLLGLRRSTSVFTKAKCSALITNLNGLYTLESSRSSLELCLADLPGDTEKARAVESAIAALTRHEWMAVETAVYLVQQIVDALDERVGSMDGRSGSQRLVVRINEEGPGPTRDKDDDGRYKRKREREG